MGLDETGPDDGDLVALLDGALAPAAAAGLEARLAAEPLLRARFDQLDAGSRPFAAAFAAVSASAPTARLDAMLAGALAQRPVRPARTVPWGAAIAAGIVLFGLGVGLRPALKALSPPTTTEAPENAAAWRQTVADYLVLTTGASLAALPSDPAMRGRDLAVLGERLGLDLSPARLAQPGLELKRVDLLQYEGAFLGEIAWLDPSGRPVAFCILARPGGTEEPQAERRGGLNILQWTNAGHAFMLIGEAPPTQLAELARPLLAIR